jgi:hypothetical protein
VQIRGCIQNFRTARLERELQIVQLPATRYSCTAILWVSLVSFTAITLCVASEWVIPKVSVYFIIYSVRKLLDTTSYFPIRLHTRFTKPPIRWVTGAVSPQIKRTEGDLAKHLHMEPTLRICELLTSTAPVSLHGVCRRRVKFTIRSSDEIGRTKDVFACKDFISWIRESKRQSLNVTSWWQFLHFYTKFKLVLIRIKCK